MKGGASPTELERYVYRREFGLTALELEDEPIDQFLLNLNIYSLIRHKEVSDRRKADGRK